MDDLPELYELYAALLDYPSQQLGLQADQCRNLLAESCPQAAEVLTSFLNWVEQEQLAQVEEIYTSVFDLQGFCCPYIGHHLFGDNYQRSWFMAKLNSGYQDKGFSCGCDLPDHVAVILRFLAHTDGDEFSQVLLEEGLIPATSKMVQAFDTDGAHPYRQVLRSLYLILQDGHPASSGIKTSLDEGGLVDA